MIKVAFIEDNIKYSDLLRTIIQSSDKLQLVYEACNAENIVKEILRVEPDVVIMDIDLPKKNGIEALLELKEVLPEINVLMLTVFKDDDKIFSAFRAGANGYLLKKDSTQKIIDAVLDLYEGKPAMSPDIARQVLDYFRKNPETQFTPESKLSHRENEILGLLINGLSYKEIADRCCISVQTLNSHIKNIYRKLEVHSRSELAARYRRK